MARTFFRAYRHPSDPERYRWEILHHGPLAKLSQRFQRRAADFVDLRVQGDRSYQELSWWRWRIVWVEIELEHLAEVRLWWWLLRRGLSPCTGELGPDDLPEALRTNYVWRWNDQRIVDTETGCVLLDMRRKDPDA